MQRPVGPFRTNDARKETAFAQLQTRVETQRSRRRSWGRGGGGRGGTPRHWRCHSLAGDLLSALSHHAGPWSFTGQVSCKRPRTFALCLGPWEACGSNSHRAGACVLRPNAAGLGRYYRETCRGSAGSPGGQQVPQRPLALLGQQPPTCAVASGCECHEGEGGPARTRRGWPRTTRFSWGPEDEGGDVGKTSPGRNRVCRRSEGGERSVHSRTSHKSRPVWPDGREGAVRRAG